MIRALVAAIALCGLAACAATAPAPGGWRELSVTAAPAALGAERVGSLEFLGGLELDAASADFGGFSDLAITPAGDLLAVTDAGFLLRARLAFAENGAPLRVTDAALAPLLDEAGRPFPDKDSADAEGMAVLPDGRIVLSFEGSQSLRVYARDGEGALTAARPGPPLAEAASLDRNQGLESLAVLPDGALLVGAEEGEAEGVMLWRARLGQAAPAPVLARLPVPAGFGLVEFEALPNGDVMALQRFYAPGVGNRIRILRLTWRGDAYAQELLAELRAPLLVDNFEGAAVFAAADGALRLAIVSDDNFNARQRTLLYVFALPASSAPPAPQGQ